MATTTVQDSAGPLRKDIADTSSVESLIWQTCKALGSLKFTVVLFALSMVIVLVGTVAQQELNMVQVKERYFTSLIAQMRLDDFVPQAFFPHERIGVEFPFPGGALIGLLLLVNLIAAKVTRFHLRAEGGKLAGGMGVFLFGCLLCYFVVVSGHSSDGVQGQPPIEYKTLWGAIVAGMGLLWVTALYQAVTAQRKGWKYISGAAAIAFGGLGIAALTGYFEMSVSSLRITWQLLQGTVVALVMLVGSVLMFGKQGGNLLLHFGIALLMVGQFAFGDTQVEQRLSLVEGQATNEFVKLDKVELVFLDSSEEGKQKVTAIPEEKLERLAGQDEILSDDRLPVDIKIVEFLPSSDLAAAGEKNAATVGNGLKFAAVFRKPSGGVSSEMDLAGGYVELLEKGTGKSLGVYMVSQLLSDTKFLSLGKRENQFEPVQVGDTAFQMGLRFARVPKPYWVKVKDVRRVNYSGTQTPRDYSSFIKLVDSDTGEIRDERVWMNNPLRYRGETFYQSDYQQLEGGKEFTSIQVVQNSGWMIPYVACMIVAIGMMYHFAGSLDRFLGRQERTERKTVDKFGVTKSVKPMRVRHVTLTTTLCVAALSLLLTVPWTHVMTAMRPESQNKTMNIYRAGEIPTRFGGRVMPLDAYARQALTAISNRSSLPMKGKSDELPPVPQDIVKRADGARSLSAMRWLMEVASGDPAIRDLHMFRIDADPILNHFGLDRRKSKLYSLAELVPQFDSFERELQLARSKDESEWTFKEGKLMELASRLNTFQQLETAFSEPAIPQLPPEFASMQLTPDQEREARFMMLSRQMAALESAPIASIIPPASDKTEASVDVPPWMPFPVARFQNIGRSINGDTEFSGVDTFAQMVQSYGKQDAAEFNKAVDEHLASVLATQPRDYDPSVVEVERWMEAVSPTLVARILYGVLLVLGLFALLLNIDSLRTGVCGGLIGVVVLHTLFLLARTYITGRAPVTNLYSSAVFIGWAGVIAGILLESMYRRGIGNLIAAGSGISSLMVAWALDVGDTMPVLQAVLDTQFWLSTHVITVTLGYAATFVSGGLGILFLATLLFGTGDADLRRDIYRMAYSATCFGILFSFVGTVLGGLWADDSWGRFWGWDPKENGALLIVIWNALMLHARWDGMVKDRGFAILAIIGNIVTAWSWFGTNQLGLGLHAYGGNSGAKIWLGIFLISQLVIIGGGFFVSQLSKARERSV
jgi:ABC-type transport system involved in cytochrome c biogenesis permease subunit